MTTDPVFVRDLAYVFVAAVAGGVLARLARQPLILGYVVGGIVVGPFTPGPSVSDLHTFELFAEIGVILLMFSIGIEFSPRELLRVRWVALLGGPLGIALCAALGAGVGVLLGWPVRQGVVVGLIISVASTMVLARLLMERGELQSRHGRVMIGITLVEDLAVVVLTALLPSFGSLEPARLWTVAGALGVAALVLAPFTLLAARVLPRVLTRVARTGSGELFGLLALALGLGTAALTHEVGLSPALGAFLAGLLISSSDYAHDTLARLLPMRDAFVALFFVTVGALIDLEAVTANVPLLATMVGLVLLGKLVVWMAVVRLFGYPLATALLVGIGLTQIGEFSFILVRVARGSGLVADDVYHATLAASLLTILANAVLVRYVPDWIGAARVSRPWPAATPADAAAGTAPGGRAIICGFGRLGSAVGEALDTFGVGYTVIDRDPDVVQALRARGVACVFGDAGNAAILRHAGAERVGLVVVALPEVDTAHLAVRAAHHLNPRARILARAHGAPEADRLRAVGATAVIQPDVETAAALIEHTLSALDLSRSSVTAYGDRFVQAMEGDATAAAGTPQTLPEVRDVTLPDGALADRSLREARVRERFGLTVLAIHGSQGEAVHNPPPESVLRAGHRLRVFGLPAQIDAFVMEAGRTD